MSLRVSCTATGGEYWSSRLISWSLRPCTPPCAFTAANSARTPHLDCPYSAAGPDCGAVCPNVIVVLVTPFSAGRWPGPGQAPAAPGSAAAALSRGQGGGLRRGLG